MKTIMNMALFVGGFVAGVSALCWSLGYTAQYPRENSTVYEDDAIKIVRHTPTKHSTFDPAVIVYKNR